MSVKLLAVGDLHIGRLPTRLPESFAHRAGDFSPAAAWDQVVRYACEAQVEAVLLAGDVVESTHDFFEALPRLQNGIATLAATGIRTLAVSGNHDVEVLPQLAERIPECELLGADGRWECASVTAANGETVDVWGWSFPALEVRHSPLTDFPGRQSSHPSIGLLHCDRDQSASVYAPVTSQALSASGLDAWLLAHIHQPDALSLENPIGYLGSVVGLDAGEPGARGPWLLEWQNNQLQRFEQCPLGPIRWERISLDISGAESVAEVEQRLSDSLEQLAAELAAEKDPSELIAIRLLLVGETNLDEGSIRARLPAPDQAQGLPGSRQRQWFLERCDSRLLPYTPLRDIAKRADQPGLLARQLIILNTTSGSTEREELIDQATPVAEQALRQGRWRDLPQPTLSREQVAEWLQQRGRAALRAMLAEERND